MDEQSKADEGLTNEIILREETVVKIYKKYPFTAFLEFIANTLSLNPKFPTRKRRMDNEVELKNVIVELGMNAPKIIERKDDRIVFEKIEGITANYYINQSKGSQAFKAGKKIGEFLPRLHSEDVAIKDFRLPNIIVNDSFYLIDHEYSTLDANRIERMTDYLTLLSSARQTNNYDPFRKGIESETNIPVFIQTLSIFTSFLHALILERDLKRLKNIYKSLKPNKTND